MRTLALLFGLMLAALAASNAPRRPTNPLLTAVQLDQRFAGTVTQRLLAGSYVYVLVRDDAGSERWVVTLVAMEPASREVEVQVFAQKARFDSPRLGRSFAPLAFGSVTARSTTHSE